MKLRIILYRKDPVGKQILDEKPRVNEKTLPLKELEKLPENTFGWLK